jgi:hypothetical protein
MLCARRRSAVAAAAVLLTFSAGSQAIADDKPAEPKIDVTGHVDWYYMMNFNHPAAGSTMAARAFDVKSDQFALAVGQVNIVKPITEKSPLGFTANITVGKTADLFHLTEPGGFNTYKYFQQLYGSFKTGPVQIDAGKWTTFAGYEVTESYLNDNYSRGLLYLLGPYYHMGVKASMPVGTKLTVLAALMNGWNNVEDDNGGKTYGVQLNFKPTDKVNLILNYIGGDEGSQTANPQPATGALFGGIGFPAAGILNTHFLDFVGTWQVTPKLKLATQVDYGTASKPGNGSGTWAGYGLWAKYQATDRLGAAIRLENFEDHGGLRSGATQNLHSLTLSLDFASHANLLHRLEYRRDKAGVTGFFGSAGNSQDTFTFSQVIKF